MLPIGRLLLQLSNRATKGFIVKTLVNNNASSAFDHKLSKDEGGEDSLSSISSGSDNSCADHSTTRPKKSDIQHLTSIIFEQVRSLYKVSGLLRRPAIQDKYIRSIGKDVIFSCYTYWDQAHVKNKFPNCSDVISRRLGVANTRRREQLRFWDRHRQGESIAAESMTLSHHNLKKSTNLKPISITVPGEKLALAELAGKTFGEKLRQPF